MAGARGNEAPPFRVLFVCTANQARSAMAEAIARHEVTLGLAAPLQFSSAGTHARPGAPATPETLRVITELGLDLRRHRARELTRPRVLAAGLVLTMTRAHIRFVQAAVPEAADRTFTLMQFWRVAAGEAADSVDELIDLVRQNAEHTRKDDIVDPVGGGMDAFRACAARLRLLIRPVVGALAAAAWRGGAAPPRRRPATPMPTAGSLPMATPFPPSRQVGAATTPARPSVFIPPAAAAQRPAVSGEEPAAALEEHAAAIAEPVASLEEGAATEPEPDVPLEEGIAAEPEPAAATGEAPAAVQQQDALEAEPAAAGEEWAAAGPEAPADEQATGRETWEAEGDGREGLGDLGDLDDPAEAGIPLLGLAPEPEPEIQVAAPEPPAAPAEPEGPPAPPREPFVRLNMFAMPASRQIPEHDPPDPDGPGSPGGTT